MAVGQRQYSSKHVRVEYGRWPKHYSALFTRGVALGYDEYGLWPKMLSSAMNFQSPILEPQIDGQQPSST
jgi:hypothetical protein